MSAPTGIARTAIPAQRPLQCRFVGCTERATVALRSKYGAPWIMCDAHAATAEPALYQGQPSDSGIVTRTAL